jgi:hypothetical protein
MIEINESSSQEIPQEEEKKMNESLQKDNGCSMLVEKYNDLLLTEKQKKEIVDKTNYYYSMKKIAIKKKKTCVLCNKSLPINTKNSQFISTYDDITFCKTLEIKCLANSPCKGWKLTYGVVFDLEKIIREQKLHIETLKRSIILNKNDMMFGYKSNKDAIELHDVLVSQLEGIMDTYSTRLYKYLSYANNNRMNEDIDKINKHIIFMTEEIKRFVSQEQIKEAVESYLSIKNDYICMKNMKQIKENSYKEHLFNCKSQFMDDEIIITRKKKKSSKEKEIIEKKERKESEILSKEDEKEKKKEQKTKQTIEKELHHLFDTYEMFDTLIEDDPDFQEQTIKEIKSLKIKIKKYGTADQKLEFNTVEELLEGKIKEIKINKNKKEEIEREKINDLLNAPNDEELKSIVESSMEELV